MVALLVAVAGGGTASAAPPRGAHSMRAALASGMIEGTVTDAVTHAPIKGIEVCAYRLEPEGVEPEGLEPSCAFTTGTGSYAIGVAAGEYVVEFFSPFGSGLNYVTRYQGGYTSWEEAEAHPLSVSAGGTDAGVNASMHEGGHITGHVDLAEHPESGIEGIEVCAFGKEGFGCAVTNSSGAYDISALPTGKYVVEFAAPPGSKLDYVPQFYEGSSTVAGAKLVTVTAGATTSGIGALLSRGGEIAGEVTVAPTGDPLPGAEVCALTSETKAVDCTFTDAKGEYALRGLAPGTYVIGFAAKGYQWQYYPSGRVFALAQQISVGAGTGVGLWPTKLLPIGYVPPPPVGPAPLPPPIPAPISQTTQTGQPAGGVAGATVHSPGILVSLTRLRSSHGKVSVPLSCSGAACTGTIRLTVRVAYRTRRHGRSVTLHRTVVLAQGAFSLAAGAHTTISLRETSAGRAYLGHGGRHPVSAQLLANVSGGAGTTLTVHVS